MSALNDIHCTVCGARLTDTKPPLHYPMTIPEMQQQILSARLCEHDFENYYLTTAPEEMK